jgi:hypothetical protein
MRSLGTAGAAIGLAVGISFLLSWVGHLDPDLVLPDGEPLVVFSEHRTRPITQETIVDDLAAMHLNVRLTRVAVETSVLEIDLLVQDPLKEGMAAMEEIGRLSAFALAESDNIARVFIRLLEPDERRGERLLAAVTGSKSDFTRKELQRLRDGERMPESWLKEKMNFMETDRWREVSSQWAVP